MDENIDKESTVNTLIGFDCVSSENFLKNNQPNLK